MIDLRRQGRRRGHPTLALASKRTEKAVDDERHARLFDAWLVRSIVFPPLLPDAHMYQGKKADYSDIIKHLSKGKGMPARVTDAVLEGFFGP
jgi:hypothetical protein